MKRKMAIIGLVVGAMSVSLLAAEPQGAQPPLPAGHPQIPADSTAAREPKLPAGHPQLPAEGGEKLPAGHPQIPAGEGKPGSDRTVRSDADLPKGHKPLNELMPQGVAAGRLSIKAIQQTPGGAPTAGDEITVQFYYQGQIVKTMKGKLDEKGERIIEKVQLGTPAAPVVRVRHAGTEYEAIGKMINSIRNSGEVTVNVYEATDQAPAWKIKAQHAILQPAPDGVHVMHVFTVENPSDKAWLGTPAGTQSEPARQTFVVQLSPGAREVGITGGFLPDRVKLDGEKLVNQHPIVPGNTEFKLEYVVPVTDGKATVTLINPAAAARTLVFVPDDGTRLTVQGATPQPNGAGMANLKMRTFAAGEQPAGGKVTMTFEGLKTIASGMDVVPGTE